MVDHSSGEEDEVGEGQLPREIRSLIHHVELHRSGWWDRALDRLVLVTLWRKAPASIDEVAQSLAALDGRLSSERVGEIITREEASGVIVPVADGRYKVSEEVDRSLRAELEGVEASEERVRELLIALVAEAGIDADPVELWRDFERLFMRPLVHEAGARVYDVLSSGADLDAAVPSYGEILKPLCDRYGHEIRAVLVALLDPSNVDVRSYVLRTLNADFVGEAAGLDAGVLEGLRASRGRPDRVRIFLDTNFLFSFLGLHDNPSNDVAGDLIQLIDRAKSTIKIELFVLPVTVDETRRVLREVMSRLKGIVPRRNLALAARELSSTGLVARFLDAAASHRGGVLTPEDFFGPYESNLVPVLRERGVELFNADLDGLTMDQAVIDDIHDQAEVQGRVRKRGSKTYESNLHDMVLWHFVNRQRPAGQDSPLEVGNWVCTVDYGLVSFDRHKRRRSRRPPVCLTPSSLVQLLQFWAPRSDELDKALVGAIREPLLFLDFDLGTEQATLRILRSISRFEGVGDLEPSTIFNILTNDALRARLETGTELSSEQETDLIEGTVIEEARRLERELSNLEAEKADLADRSRIDLEEKAREAEGLRGMLAARDTDVSTLSQEVDDLRRRLADERRVGQDKVEELASGHDELQRRLDEMESAKERGRERTRLIAWLVGIGVVLAAGVVVASSLLDDHFGNAWIAWGGIAAVGALALLLAGDALMRRAPSFADNRFHRLLVSGRKGIVAILFAVLTGLLATAIWEASRDLNGGGTSTTVPQP